MVPEDREGQVRRRRSRSTGQIKKTELDEYENFREKGIIGVKVDDGDQLLSAALTDGTREFLIATKLGQSHPLPRGAGAPDGPRDDAA